MRLTHFQRNLIQGQGPYLMAGAVLVVLLGCTGSASASRCTPNTTKRHDTLHLPFSKPTSLFTWLEHNPSPSRGQTARSQHCARCCHYTAGQKRRGRAVPTHRNPLLASQGCAGAGPICPDPLLPSSHWRRQHNLGRTLPIQDGTNSLQAKPRLIPVQISMPPSSLSSLTCCRP